jgi:hypothetical protein
MKSAGWYAAALSEWYHLRQNATFQTGGAAFDKHTIPLYQSTLYPMYTESD